MNARDTYFSTSNGFWTLSSTQWMWEKVANLESMVLDHCITLLEHVISVRTSYFDIDFASQVKLTKLPLIHCFVMSSNSSLKRIVFSCQSRDLKCNAQCWKLWFMFLWPVWIFFSVIVMFLKLRWTCLNNHMQNLSQITTHLQSAHEKLHILGFPKADHFANVVRIVLFEYFIGSVVELNFC